MSDRLFKRVLLTSSAGLALGMLPSAALAQTVEPSAAAPGDAQDIVVTGIRASALKSQELKREASSVIEVVSLEDLGKYSDQNIADALQRVPGVQIERNDAGISGDRASIRGLGPSFVTVTVNGRIPFSGGNEGISALRQYNFDALPSEIVSGILVYKTPTAELVEPGLAGAIELKTLRPLDYRSPFGRNVFGAITGRLEDDSQTRSLGKRVSGVVGGKFFGDTLGLYVAGIYSDANVRKDELLARFARKDLRFDDNSDGVVDRTVTNVLVPNQPTLSSDTGVDQRRAISTGLQYRPSSQFEFNADFSYSKYAALQNRAMSDIAFGPNGAGQGIFAGISRPGGYVVENNQLVAFDTSKITFDNPAPHPVGVGPTALLFNNTSETYLYGVNFAWTGDHSRLSGDYSHSKLDFRQKLGLAIAVSSPNPLNNGPITWDGRPDVPLLTGLNNVFNPPNTLRDGFFARDYVNATRADEVRLDYEHDVGDAFKVKFGVRAQDTNVNVSSRSLFTGPCCGSGSEYGYDNAAALRIGQGIDTGRDAGFLSRFGFGTVLPLSDYYGGLNTLPALRDAAFSGDTDPALTFRVREKTTALYAQAEGKGDLLGMPAEGNVGLRAVRTEVEATAFTAVQTISAVGNVVISRDSREITDKTSYWNYLPSANLTLHPSDNMNVRLGVAKVMSRPEYEALAPRNTVTFIDPTDPLRDPTANPTASGGNTRLKPLTAWTFDATVEYYTPNKGAIYASAFYKKVKNFVLNQPQLGVTLPGFGAQRFDTVQPVNFSDGRVLGFEVGLDQPLTFLPAPLDGFGIQANYTYVDSSFDKTTEALSFGFPGASKHNFNAVGYYEKSGFAARVAYVYRSDYFVNLGGGGDRSSEPQFTKGSDQLNASISYKITPNIEVSFAGVNLTRSNRRDFVVNPGFFRSFIERSRLISFGVRAAF